MKKLLLRILTVLMIFMSINFNVSADNTQAEMLNGDWAYISRFEIDAIHDGTGPLDTSEDPDNVSYKDRQGNDSGPDNGIVRTFDTVSYDLSYSTAMSDTYLIIEKGYLYYEFVLPLDVDKAEWEVTGMTWIGIKVDSVAELADKQDGESYYCLEKKVVDGVMSQVLTGKRYLVPSPPNPSAFPGSGTLNAVVRVLNMEHNSQLIPKFTLWLEHNHLEGECPVHGRVEPVTIYGDPVTVTAELRLNVQLEQTEVTAEDNWHWEFPDKPVYENGEEIVYTVEVDEIDKFDITHHFRKKDTPPPMGDNFNAVPYIVASVVSLGGIIIVWRKRNEKEVD